MENMIIIGNNKCLKSDLLSKYRNKIKLIYIDPPYNTKTCKSYQDKFDKDKWSKYIRKVITCLYDYLTDDGLIFISIDDSEYARLKIICDNIFGPNFIGTFITKQTQRSNSKLVNIVHEYVLCYAKNKQKIKPFKVKRIDIPEQKRMIDDIQSKVKETFKLKGLDKAEQVLDNLITKYCKKYDITWLKNYRCIDDKGDIYYPSDLSTPSNPRQVCIPSINLFLKPLKTRGWTSDEKFKALYKKGLLVTKNNRPYCKKYLIESEDNAQSILNFYSRQGTSDLNKLGLKGIFDTPKPVELIKFLIRISNLKYNDIILDCFGGSGTTAHAVIEINHENNKDIKFILIQKKELVDKKTKVYKSCLKYGIRPYISEILKLRIKTVLEKYGISRKSIRLLNFEQT